MVQSSAMLLDGSLADTLRQMLRNEAKLRDLIEKGQ